MDNKDQKQMSDLGEANNYNESPTTITSNQPNTVKEYPCIRLTTSQLPGLKGLDVGDKVKLIVDAEVKGINISYQAKNGSETSVELKFLQANAKVTDKSEPIVQTSQDKQEQEKKFNKDLGLDNTDNAE